MSVNNLKPSKDTHETTRTQTGGEPNIPTKITDLPHSTFEHVITHQVENIIEKKVKEKIKASIKEAREKMENTDKQKLIDKAIEAQKEQLNKEKKDNTAEQKSKLADKITDLFSDEIKNKKIEALEEKNQKLEKKDQEKTTAINETWDKLSKPRQLFKEWFKIREINNYITKLKNLPETPINKKLIYLMSLSTRKTSRISVSIFWSKSRNRSAGVKTDLRRITHFSFGKKTEQEKINNMLKEAKTLFENKKWDSVRVKTKKKEAMRLYDDTVQKRKKQRTEEITKKHGY